MFVGLIHLVLGSLTKILHAVSSVQSVSNLLVRLHKTLQLDVQVFVLVLQNSAVVLESVNFRSQVVIAALHRLVRETKIVLIATGHCKGFLSSSDLSFKIVKIGR